MAEKSKVKFLSFPRLENFCVVYQRHYSQKDIEDIFNDLNPRLLLVHVPTRHIAHFFSHLRIKAFSKPLLKIDLAEIKSFLRRY